MIILCILTFKNVMRVKTIVLKTRIFFYLKKLALRCEQTKINKYCRNSLGEFDIFNRNVCSHQVHDSCT